MKKIKAVGLLIFLTSIILVALFVTLSKEEERFTQDRTLITTQKSYIQEIAKSILYTHRYKKEIPPGIDEKMHLFLNNLKLHRQDQQQDPQIAGLSHEFFDLVARFKDIYSGHIPYNIVILDRLVNDIYQKNMQLIVAFDRYSQVREATHAQKIQRYRIAQYLLFALLILLLIYAFTQLDSILRFVQKFTRTSSRIIEDSTIKGLEPMQIESRNDALKKATANFNTLVANIEDSIDTSLHSAEHTLESLEHSEQHIQQLLLLLDEMQEEQKTEADKKEEILIESLESLMEMIVSLKKVKKDLKKLL